MYKRSALSSAIVLAGSVWGGAALANTETGAQFSSAAEINKVSEWIGKDVQDNEGNDVGEISDFALNIKDGSIAYAVVETGGMFSKKSIAVPLTALSTSAENDNELTLQVSQSEWKSAETFSGSDWPLKASLAAGTGAAVAGRGTGASTSTDADTGWQRSEDREDQYDQGTGSVSSRTDEGAGTRWPQSGDQDDQYDQGTESVSSFDRDVEFDTLDTDGDGYITVEEYKAARGSEATAGIDKDDDDRISRSEFAAFEAQREQEGRAQKKSSTYDRYEKSDKDHGYDSDDTDDLEIDD